MDTEILIYFAATAIAYMVGITLGLPAGYRGGRVDAVLSFIANLVLAFPVILLFYLLVTPEIRESVPVDLGIFTIPWSIPIGMAARIAPRSAAATPRRPCGRSGACEPGRIARARQSPGW